MKKKCQVVILSTKKVPIIGQLMQFHSNQYSENNYKKGFLTTCKNIGYDIERWHGHHLYFTTDEELKVGDFGINLTTNSIFRIKSIVDKLKYNVDFITGGNISNTICLEEWSHAKITKIVASTNESLGLSRPSNEFLKAYCEAYNSNPITEVNIEYDSFTSYMPTLINGVIHQIETKSTKLKVAPDNTITISKVEERMFTLEELIRVVKSAWYTGMDRGKYKEDLQPSYENEVISKWLKDKLK